MPEITIWDSLSLDLQK